jgi:4a-hydroxytetrahydrobiopterin dehydratase
MKPSSTPKKNSRVSARNAALLNLLATPGLGSLMARRWVAGSGQLALALLGFGLVTGWFMRVMIGFYGQISGGETVAADGRLGLLGGGLFAGAWGWSLVTSLSLLRAASQAQLAAMEIFPGGQVKLAEASLLRALSARPQWQRQGSMIARTFVFADFLAAMKFVNAVADLAEQAQHHPDVDIRWNKVTLALTTHDVGGLTRKDFARAWKLNAAERKLMVKLD